MDRTTLLRDGLSTHGEKGLRSAGSALPSPTERICAGHGGSKRGTIMRLRIGYELQYHFPQPTPVIMMLNIHYTRVSDLEGPDHIVVRPSVPISGYRDGFGNWCSRMLAP